MDIASLSTALSMRNLQQDYGIAMLSKQLDTLEDLGATMVQSMNEMPKAALEQSVNPAVGGNFDFSV